MELDPFSLWDYARMLSCEPRTKPYVDALRATVKPGDVVMDIGTGTGFFAILAVQCGASKVIAIEPNDVISVAKQSALDNGCGDKIEFFKGFSTDYLGTERADVIISDLRGAMPFYRNHIPVIKDARSRLLAEGGTLIATKDKVYAALARCDDVYKVYDSYAGSNTYGVDLSAGHTNAINSLHWFFPTADQMRSEKQLFSEIDYRVVESPNAAKQLEFTASQDGPCHGIVMWFDTHLGEADVISNAPDISVKQYRSQFLPFEKPLTLKRGETVMVEISAALIAGEYVWSWTTYYPADQGKRFEQSTFFAGSMSI